MVNRTRSYIDLRSKEIKKRLVAWINKRCYKCKKFISKFSNENKLCPRCSYKARLKRNDNWNKTNLDSILYRRTYMYILRNSNKLKVGDIIG